MKITENNMIKPGSGTRDSVRATEMAKEEKKRRKKSLFVFHEIKRAIILKK
jgi:hypothetical protein